MRRRRWTLDELRATAIQVTSMQQLLKRLNLRPAGGNYSFVKKHIIEQNIPIDHFRRTPWNKGKHPGRLPVLSLETILVEKSSFQSAKLKKRLFAA